MLQPLRDVERVRHFHCAETTVDGVLPGITLQIEEESMRFRLYFFLTGGCYTLKGNSNTPTNLIIQLCVKIGFTFSGFFLNCWIK